jgi:hypothetical protein
VAAAGQPGGGIQDAVAQGLRFGLGRVVIQGEQAEPGQQGRGGQGGGLPSSQVRSTSYGRRTGSLTKRREFSGLAVVCWIKVDGGQGAGGTEVV